MTIDREGFERALEAQRARRAKSAFGGPQQAEFFAPSDNTRSVLEQAGDCFEGYSTTRLAGVPVLALFDGSGQEVASLSAGASGYVVLARTPFYVESGGQVSDTGRIFSESGGFTAGVQNVAKATGWPRLHQVQVEQGTVEVGHLVTVEVSDELRDATRRNHTATHLLHAALRRVLGPHVKQKGSLVSPDRLRFDFVHFAPLTREEMAEVERLVTVEVCRNTPVQTEVRSTQEARRGSRGCSANPENRCGGLCPRLQHGVVRRRTYYTGDIGMASSRRASRRACGASGDNHQHKHIRTSTALAGCCRRLNVGQRRPEAVDRLQADVKRRQDQPVKLNRRARPQPRRAGRADWR
jgi:Ser-tRNA(Ala) deacylase AlaX